MLKIFASTVATLDSNVYTGGGTSYAAEKVTAAAVDLLQREPELAVVRLRNRLLEGTSELGDNVRALCE